MTLLRAGWVPLLLLNLSGICGQESAPPTLNGLPLLVEEDFEEGLDDWTFTDSAAWTIEKEGENSVLSLSGESDYEPPVRSPLNMALMTDYRVGDFILEVEVKSTSREYGHRDICLFFGWQNAAEFYYSHIATQADPHANSIFLVDHEPRVSIATERTDGTRWINGKYHRVRIVRDAADGTIEVYFDDMEKPIMRATDRTHTFGRIGLGSFDDPGRFDNLKLWGRRVTSAGATDE